MSEITSIVDNKMMSTHTTIFGGLLLYLSPVKTKKNVAECCLLGGCHMLCMELTPVLGGEQIPAISQMSMKGRVKAIENHSSTKVFSEAHIMK